MNSVAARTFDHQACLYGSGEQFLEMALPFLETGLANGEPVLAVTTPANLELISSALGTRADDVDYAESAFFGRRPPQRIAAFHRYFQRHRPGRDGAQIRVLAEPVWTGRSVREIAAWKRMEAALNVALAETSIFMICPYDTRITGPGILDSARRTHPALAHGPDAIPSPDYADPEAFAGESYGRPLPEPPDGSAAFEFDGNLRSLRQFVASRAAAHGLADDRAGLLVQAAGEVGTYLKYLDPGHVAVRTWEQAGAVICDFSKRRPASATRSSACGPPGWRPGRATGSG